MESEILPLAIEENLGVVTYSPVGGGLLSGKYSGEKQAQLGRLLENKEYEARYGEGWVFEVAEKFTTLAQQLNIHPVTLAVSWVAHNPAVTCPIIGARNLQQLQPSLASNQFEMSDELYARITALSRRPAPATDRLEEQV